MNRFLHHIVPKLPAIAVISFALLAAADRYGFGEKSLSCHDPAARKIVLDQFSVSMPQRRTVMKSTTTRYVDPATGARLCSCEVGFVDTGTGDLVSGYKVDYATRMLDHMRPAVDITGFSAIAPGRQD